MNRREARREFKERIPQKGVFAVRCTATGEAWVAASGNLKATETGQWFMLRIGTHINKELQAAWNTHGETAFAFEILETFDPEAPPMTLQDLSRGRPRYWMEKLSASAL